MGRPEPNPDELIELAAVVRSHGLRGELLLKPFNPDSTLLLDVERVLLKASDGRVASYRVETARLHSGSILLALHDVRSREAADPLRGSLVCVTRKELPALEEGEHYLVDLVGLTAFDAQGAELGTVTELIEYPSVNCLVVTGPEGTYEVPNLERYVLELDVDAARVVVDHLDELELTKPKER